ncbi:hypothetical protein KIN20_019626 [Parelaphostrongylus tenuis]|uniref:Serine/threonine-protein phosphatase n=2 Tax=Strongyloidea TaxID=27829 RepID=A0AAD5MLG3_PARTN|nr:hypothetical protein KIN20_019626 [Parelaphostrongylus tenuis]
MVPFTSSSLYLSKQLQQNRLQIVSAVHHSVPIAEQTNKQCTKATQKSAAQRRGRRLQQNLTCGRNHQPLCTRDCSPSRKLGLKACPSYPIKYSSEELKDVQRCSIELFKMESTLAEINPPIVIVGDIHGQYFDLLRMFSKFSEGNQHGSMRVKYIFLGDYVDRGRRSLECVCLVLTLKILFPRKYQILRGNHECKGINRVYGFYDELLDRFEKEEAERLWLGFNEVFAWMPLAGLVGKKILCMHGGISAYLNSLDDIRRIARPLEEPNVNPLAMDLLWADPMLNIQGYAPNTVRGVATFFGEDAVVHCCQKLKIDLIVRAHQNNKGAVVYVDKQGKIGFKVLSPLDQPPYDDGTTKTAGPDDKSFRLSRKTQQTSTGMSLNLKAA